MAKVKLLNFEIVSLKSDGKRIIDYIQRKMCEMAKKRGEMTILIANF